MTAAAMVARAQDGGVGDGDPAARPRRRRFTAEYKMRVLAEYDAITDAGAKGALLRREGLYTSHLAEWRRARELGAIRELEPKTRPARRTADQLELERARRRIERLEDELAKHRLALEIQGKASELLERLLAESDEDKRQP